MALTRKMLKAMGIEEEKIEEIVDAHRETVDALKADRDKYKEDADKLPEIQKENEDLKKEVEDKAADPYKEKYEKEHKAFEDYKKGIEAENLKAKKTEAYKALLKDAGVSDKRIDTIVKVTVIDEIELDADGKIKDAEAKKKAVQDEYPEFIVSEDTKGADVKTPPDNKGGAGAKTLSRAAQVAQRHNERLYGVKGDNSK